jgi:hypothetical protein
MGYDLGGVRVIAACANSPVYSGEYYEALEFLTQSKMGMTSV